MNIVFMYQLGVLIFIPGHMTMVFGGVDMLFGFMGFIFFLFWVHGVHFLGVLVIMFTVFINLGSS